MENRQEQNGAQETLDHLEGDAHILFAGCSPLFRNHEVAEERPGGRCALAFFRSANVWPEAPSSRLPPTPRAPHTFSAFWLRSSVVSVLISLISDDALRSRGFDPYSGCFVVPHTILVSCAIVDPLTFAAKDASIATAFS